jgi:hypothetical protein
MLTWGGPKLGWLEWSVLPMGMKQSPAVLNTALTYVLKEFEESAKHSQIVVARYICGRHFLAGDSVAVKEKWLKKLIDLLILWSFTPSKEKVQRSSEGGLVILGHHRESICSYVCMFCEALSNLPWHGMCLLRGPSVANDSSDCLYIYSIF